MRKKKGTDWRKVVFVIVALLVIFSMVLLELLYLLGPAP